MMMIKGDREPGHLPSEEFLAQMGKYNQELSKAGLLLDLAALHWSAEGVRVKFSAGKRTVIDGPFGEAKEIVAGYWILQVKSMEEAIEWAKRLPFEAGGEPEAEGEIELRQLFELRSSVSVRRLNEGASSKGSCRNRNGWKRFVYGVAPSCAPIESRSASAALNGRTITVKSSMSPSVLV
jgi:hypothetical protein